MSQGFYPSSQDESVRLVQPVAGGEHDPRLVPTVGLKGTLYVWFDTLNVFQKQDDGRSTNWLLLTLSGGSSVSYSVRTVISALDLTNKFFTLTGYTPLQGSLVVTIKNAPGQTYGDDYILQNINEIGWAGLDWDGQISLGDVVQVIFHE